MQLLSTMYFNLSGIQSRVRKKKKKESKDLGNFIIDQIYCGLRAVFPLHLSRSFCKSSSC